MAPQAKNFGENILLDVIWRCSSFPENPISSVQCRHNCPSDHVPTFSPIPMINYSQLRVNDGCAFTDEPARSTAFLILSGHAHDRAHCTKSFQFLKPPINDSLWPVQPLPAVARLCQFRTVAKSKFLFFAKTCFAWNPVAMLCCKHAGKCA